MKTFKVIGVIAIMLFSFYYTEKISNYVLEKNQLYQNIDNQKEEYYISSVSAIITDDYIVPGYNGMEVNVKESYYNMKSINVFNEFYLVFDEITPEESLENNKDKIIIQGNTLKKGVAFVLEDDLEILNYFEQNKIKANVLVTTNNFDKNSYFEQINNDVQKYDKLDSLLENNSLNKNICILNDNIEEICRKKEKYLVQPTEVNNSNIINVKNNIQSGKIFLVKKGTSLDNLKLLIKTVNYFDLDIIYLSEMIRENRN